MRVVLTDRPTDRGPRFVFRHHGSDCDCQCACPTDGAPTPVLALPLAYYLELTPACNSRCPGCGNVYAADRAALAAPLDGPGWRDLIARLASHARRFKLTGGEATLHPDLDAIVQAIEARGVPFTLFTNGRWPCPEALIKLLKRSSTCEGMLVSLHGPDPVTHGAFCGVPESFDETVRNIRRAADAGLDVAVSLVITAHNWERVEETLDLALRLGANHLVCNRFIGARVDDRVPLRAAVARIEALRAAGRPVRFGNCIPQCFTPSSARGCTAGSTFATVDPWGRMRPCNHAPLVAGDLGTQSVREVWHGSMMTYWRALVPVECRTCAALATCHGGCRAQALLLERPHDPLMRAPLTAADVKSTAPLVLYVGLRPQGTFTRRFVGQVEVLQQGERVFPVPGGCGALVVYLDGSLTLAQIARRYGPVALDWVGALYQEGFVEWAEKA